MFKLILRNIGARKMRLAMSALAIVLGVAFLSGVLVFSNGLSKTFDGIIQGTTPDGVVRVARGPDLAANTEPRLAGCGRSHPNGLEPARVARAGGGTSTRATLVGQ